MDERKLNEDERINLKIEAMSLAIKAIGTGQFDGYSLDQLADQIFTYLLS